MKGQERNRTRRQGPGLHSTKEMTTTDPKHAFSLQSIEFDQKITDVQNMYSKKMATITMTVVTKVDYAATLRSDEVPALNYSMFIKEMTGNMNRLFDSQDPYEVLENATDLERAKDQMRREEFSKADGGTRYVQFRYLIRVVMDTNTSNAINAKQEKREELPWFFPKGSGKGPYSFVQTLLKLDSRNTSTAFSSSLPKKKITLTNGGFADAKKLTFETSENTAIAAFIDEGQDISAPPDAESTGKPRLELHFKPLVYFDGDLKEGQQYVRNTRIDFVYKSSDNPLPPSIAEMTRLKSDIKFKLIAEMKQDFVSDLWSTITWFESKETGNVRRSVAFIIQSKNGTASDAAPFRPKEWANLKGMYNWKLAKGDTVKANTPELYFRELYKGYTIQVKDMGNEVKAEYKFEVKKSEAAEYAGIPKQLEYALLLTKTR